MRTTPTPADLHIAPRDRRFGRDRPLDRWWNDDDPFTTAVFNALSATFPKGEAFFVDSVKRFREGAPPKLEADIAAFVRQEVAHSREHLAFNRLLTRQTYDLSPLEDRVDQWLARTAHKPRILALAGTMALEHFTAMLAHVLLSRPELLVAADPEAARLWRWHAIEEIEHKGVAYDTWLHATRDWTRVRRWFVKALVMVRVTRRFPFDRTRGALELLRQDGITGWRAWRGLARAVFISPGIAHGLLRPWFAYFRPGFHPWTIDDRPLIAAAEATLAP